MNVQRQQQILEKKQQTLLDQYVWPAAIPTQLKEQCLQNFCNHMSMSVLRQSTCIICNIRASSNTITECALQDIPNLDKLSCYTDLMDIIPRMRQPTQGANIQFVLMHVYTSLFLQMRMQIRASFLCPTRSSTKKDII
jgi:hypothetical protein